MLIHNTTTEVESNKPMLREKLFTPSVMNEQYDIAYTKGVERRCRGSP